MGFFIIISGLAGGCLLSVLVGIIGSRRTIGFTLAFLLSLLFTPLVGLIITLLCDPRSDIEPHNGCLDTLLAIVGGFFVLLALLMFFSVGMAAV